MMMRLCHIFTIYVTKVRTSQFGVDLQHFYQTCQINQSKWILSVQSPPINRTRHNILHLVYVIGNINNYQTCMIFSPKFSHIYTFHKQNLILSANSRFCEFYVMCKINAHT